MERLEFMADAAATVGVDTPQLRPASNVEACVEPIDMMGVA